MYATVYVEQTPVAATVRARSALERIDYADAFRVATAGEGERTAEEWARAMLQGAPAATRQALREGWRMLGLRLGPTEDPDRVLGWPMRERGPDCVVLAATSWLGMRAELVFLREPDALRFSTLITLRNPLARVVWATIAAKHRRVVRQLLAQACRSPAGARS